MKAIIFDAHMRDLFRFAHIQPNELVAVLPFAINLFYIDFGSAIRVGNRVSF